MATHVFILGAGASVSTGAPLIWNFLDTAYRLKHQGNNIDHEAFELVFQALSELKRAHSKAILDANNIEAAFSAFEMATILGRMGSFNEFERLGQAIRKVIAQTLESTIEYPLEKPQSRPGKKNLPPKPIATNDYRNLFRAIKSNGRDNTAIITFNYDIAIDFAAKEAFRELAYHIDDNERAGFPLLKLHGSCNWFEKDDGNLILLDVSQAKRIPASENSVYLSCTTATVPGRVKNVFVVPPTWSKGDYYKRMKPVWSEAARQLAEAECVYIIGYSLPPSDQFFSHLYAVGTISEAPLRRFWVFDLDPKVEARYRALVGQDANRGFFFNPGPFSNSIRVLENALSSPWASAEDCLAGSGKVKQR